MLLVLGMLVVVAGAVGFGFWAFQQKAEAEKQKELADEKSRIAVEQTEKAEAAKVRSDSLLEQVLMEQDKNRLEQGKTMLALEDANRKEKARKQEESAKNKLNFDKIFNDAEKLLKAKQYQNAKEKYLKALKIAPNREKAREIEEKIKECNNH